MKVNEVIGFCLMAMFAGLMIGISGMASLLSTTRIEGGLGKFIGSFMFSLGLYTILTFEMKLFTGLVPSIPTMGVKNMWKLPVCFVCNAIGVILSGWALTFMPVFQEVSTAGSLLIATKLNMDTWAMNAVCSGALCGILITIAVWALHHTMFKGLSTSMGVILPIIVFVFCGFDHSVANVLYFYFLGEFSWKVIAYVLLSIVGNVIGGLLLPLSMMIRDLHKGKETVEAELEEEFGEDSPKRN
jgi:formate/nitrite transporter FocA (FNT family)